MSTTGSSINPSRERGVPQMVEVTTHDGYTVRGPVGDGGVWHVEVVDPLSGEVVSRNTYPTRALAMRSIAEYLTNTGATMSKGTAPPIGHKLAVASVPQLNGRHRPNATKGPNPTVEPHRGFSIRAVKEVLEEYGLDPSAELAKILQAKKRVFTKGPDGKPVPAFKMDPETGQAELDPLTGAPVPDYEYDLSGKDRSYLLIELQQYVTPKLRAVEHSGKVETPLSEEQVDARIQQILDQHPELAAVALAKAKGMKS